MKGERGISLIDKCQGRACQSCEMLTSWHHPFPRPLPWEMMELVRLLKLNYGQQIIRVVDAETYIRNDLALHCLDHHQKTQVRVVSA